MSIYVIENNVRYENHTDNNLKWSDKKFKQFQLQSSRILRVSAATVVLWLMQRVKN